MISGNSRFIAKTAFTGSDKVYLLVTACGSSGNTGGYAEAFFQSIGKKWMGWHTFYMPICYVAFMENPDIEHAAQMNQAAMGNRKKPIP